MYPSRSLNPTLSSKRFRKGTHRVCSPIETWNRIAPLLPEFGITRVADVTGLDILGIPVYQAVRPSSRNISVSQGKGLDIDAARVSAAMEALELAHAECLEDLEQITTTLEQMQTMNCIRLDDLAWAQEPCSALDRRLHWLRAEALHRGKSGWLPREMIELDFSLAPTPRSNWFHRTSNGLASGNTYEEACVHALSELIERHALAIAQRDSTHRRPIALDTIRDEDVLKLIESVRRVDSKIALFDSTCNIGVPVVSAELVLPDTSRIWGGSGCHPSPAIALTRAITEAAQSRLTFLSGARDDLEVPSLLLSGSALYDRFLEPADGVDFAGLPDLSSDDVGRDMSLLCQRLDGRGHPPYIVDLSRSDAAVSVVRAFAPGLEEVIDV